MVGYSRLMGEDEEGTIAALAERRKVSDALIARHGGRIFNTGGESVTAELASAVEAVRAAVEIQEKAAALTAALPKEKHMRFRMGLHMSDVVIKGDDLLGDGVNVAARLEGIASPDCGICISESVHQHVKSSLQVPFRDMGVMSMTLKSGKVRAYSVDLAVLATGAPPPPRVIREINPGRPIAATILIAFVVIATAMSD